MTGKSKLLNKPIIIEAIEPERVYVLLGIAPLYHPLYPDDKEIISQGNIENKLEQELVETIKKSCKAHGMHLIRAPNTNPPFIMEDSCN